MSSNMISLNPGPLYVDLETRKVRPGPHTNHESWKLVGFQPDVDTERVTLFMRGFMDDPQKAVGMVPTFIDDDGIFSLSVPVRSVHDHRTGQEEGE